MKKTSTFQNGLIWFGAGVSLAEILTGTSFAPLGMAKGFAAILIGHIIGCAMMLLAGLIGGRTGRSAMETVKMSFGQKGTDYSVDRRGHHRPGLDQQNHDGRAVYPHAGAV